MIYLFKKIKKDKKASLTIIFSFIVVGLFIPVCAVMYDLSMAKIYKEDMKNIMQMSTLSCIPHADNKFNESECRSIIQETMKQNIESAKGNVNVRNKLVLKGDPTITFDGKSVKIDMEGSYTPTFLKIGDFANGIPIKPATVTVSASKVDTSKTNPSTSTTDGTSPQTGP